MSWLERLLDAPWGVAPPVFWGRVAAFVFFLVWGLSVSLGSMTAMPRFLHLTVILFHEAGHMLMLFFPQVVMVAGGSLMQTAIPMAAVVSFVRKDDNFAAAICLCWAAMSVMDTSIYAYDAADPQLPLIGGGTGADRFHDFIFMFEYFGQLAHAKALAIAMKLVAIGVFLLSMVWAGWLLIKQHEHLERN